jgi:hypothetical protein
VRDNEGGAQAAQEQVPAESTDRRVGAVLEQSASLRIEFSLANWRGVVRPDVRSFYLDQRTHAWKPTRKGVTTRPEAFGEFVANVLRLQTALEQAHGR